MSCTLTYTIVNSQVAITETQIDYQGQPATIQQSHAYIEAVPVDIAGKTLSLVLPADTVTDYPEGATLEIVVSVTGDKN